MKWFEYHKTHRNEFAIQELGNSYSALLPFQQDYVDDCLANQWFKIYIKK